MTINPRATLLVKPGDPSDVYQIGKPRYITPSVAGTLSTARPTYEMEGDDVKQWHSVLWTIFTDPLDANIAGSVCLISVWRYYASASPYVTGALGLSPYNKRGQWVQGEHRWLALNGSALPFPEFVTIPTYNADRMYFEIRQFQNTSGVAVNWIGQALYGVTPRTPDGSMPPVVAPDATASASASFDDTKCTPYGEIGVGIPMAYNTGAILVDFELIAVRLQLAAAPVALNEPFVVRAGAGGTILYQVDPTLVFGGLTDIVFEPKTRSLHNSGVSIDCAWTNTGLINYTLLVLIRNELSV